MYDHRVALVIGTRPEAIKLAPVAKALDVRGVRPRIVFTGQHPHLRAADFGLERFPQLNLGCAGQRDPQKHVRLVTRSLAGAAGDCQLLVVQGDTSSALGGALGAAQAGMTIAHVEAGLRSHDRFNPWPEEDFRIAIDHLAELLFAPTELSAANLRREGVSGQIFVTGNTGIDTLLENMPQRTGRRAGVKRLLVTCHRRESWGEALEAISQALVQIARRDDRILTVVLHPNPAAADHMRSLLGNRSNIVLRDACSHAEMLKLMRDSDLVLSDSGGMQEEAPALGVPLLVLRERTERPEGVASGNLIMVGRDAGQIRSVVERLLDDDRMLDRMRRPSRPYGDGHAGQRIAKAIEDWINQRASDPLDCAVPLPVPTG